MISISNIIPFIIAFFYYSKVSHISAFCAVLQQRKYDMLILRLNSEPTSHNNENIDDAGESYMDDTDLFTGVYQNDDTISKQKGMIEEFNIRSFRISLEEANTRRFLRDIKSKPRKLPYKDARLWIQANLGVDTEEEFYDLVANGCLRTPYIPKRPEAYYKESGEWVSWDHFLNGIFETSGRTVSDAGDDNEDKPSRTPDMN